MADMPWGMVAHVLYPSLDPDRCASTSPIIVHDVIRSEIGFGGILIADDIGMQALSGSMRERAEATLAAGLDLTLHCNGDLKQMTSLMEAVPKIGTGVLITLASVRATMRTMTPDPAKAARSRLATLMG
jgi:beta-N-acetylhexosaminidase